MPTLPPEFADDLARSTESTTPTATLYLIAASLASAKSLKRTEPENADKWQQVIASLEQCVETIKPLVTE